MADFQSKLGDGLSKLSGGIEQGKQKLQVAQEISRLNKGVNELSQKKSKVLLELGQLTYKKIREGSIQDEELLELTNSLVGLDKNTYSSMKKISELSQTNNEGNACPSCAMVNAANDKFCGSCGTKLEEQKEANLQDAIQCSQCEEMIPDGAIFCPCCGQKVIKVSSLGGE